MNKASLVARIIAQLDAELQRSANAARVAQAEATDDQSRAEHKYDTRGLEASYLAHGQSRQALEIKQARQQFGALTLREFGPREPIALGALIELDDHGERLFYFLGPCAGGTEVTEADRLVQVITAQSPLGRQLLGRRAGDPLPTGGRVVSIA